MNLTNGKDLLRLLKSILDEIAATKQYSQQWFNSKTHRYSFGLNRLYRRILKRRETMIAAEHLQLSIDKIGIYAEDIAALMEHGAARNGSADMPPVTDTPGISTSVWRDIMNSSFMQRLDSDIEPYLQRADIPRVNHLIRYHFASLVNTAAFNRKARWCPVCYTFADKFSEAGVVSRQDALCDHCRALERHRFVWFFFNTRTDLFDGRPKHFLHIAPEQCFEPRLRQRLGDNYLTADIESPIAMVKMDITSIQYPDESFDAIYCSHVLEHVQNDRLAMRELHRVLRKDGWAILLVPIIADRTFEDPSIVDFQEREKAFGQKDHVRRYGPDFVDRLRESGFEVTVTRVSDMFDGDATTLMGFSPDDSIFFCTKA